jgi:uncharacterized membrane protein
MGIKRYWDHLTTTRFALRRAFPPATLDAIEAAIRSSEATHGGEIQFAIETSLELRDLRAGVTARLQAERAFAELGVWDTAQNSGILIYVLLAEHDIEIVADRGYRPNVAPAEWRGICVDMERAFADGHFRDGSIAAIDAVTAIAAAEFPPGPDDVDERPNRPVIL